MSLEDLIQATPDMRYAAYFVTLLLCITGVIVIVFNNVEQRATAPAAHAPLTRKAARNITADSAFLVTNAINEMLLCMDTGDSEGFAQLFTEDGVVEIPFV